MRSIRRFLVFVSAVIVISSLTGFLLSHNDLSDVKSKSLPILKESIHSTSYLESKIGSSVYGNETMIPLQYRASSWEPLIISYCPKSYASAAPCILKHNNHSNLIEAQELIFPQFQVRLPLFLSDTHKNDWINLSKQQIDRFVINNDWAIYYQEHGQNLVFNHSLYQGDPPADSWGEKSCMGIATDHNSFLTSPAVYESFVNMSGKAPVKNLVIATSPDSWSFQHFLDRITVTIAQALLIQNEDATDFTVISGRLPDFKYSDQFYKLMGATEHIHNVYEIAAERIIFSCRAPLIHPFSTKLTSQRLGVFRKGYKSLSERKTIYYLSRSMGLERNDGRRMVNENKILSELQKLVAKRGLNESVEIFNPELFHSLDELVDTLSQNAMALIGPHGAAHYNGRFALPHTLIVEFIPKGRFAVMFFEQARLLDQKYAALILESANDVHDMILQDMDGFIKFLDSELGKEEPSSPLLSTPYGWSVPN